MLELESQIFGIGSSLTKVIFMIKIERIFQLSAEVGMEPAAKRRREESDSDPGEVEEASVQQEDVDIGSIKDKLSKKKKKTKEPKDFVESVADEELGGHSKLLCCAI